MKEEKTICDPPYLIDKESGEVIDVCIEPNDTSQDKDLEHYSITPPVPYVPQKYVEKMKEYNKWLKGKEKFIELMHKMSKKINYLKEIQDT
jgi:hypothetical protein